MSVTSAFSISKPYLRANQIFNSTSM